MNLDWTLGVVKWINLHHPDISYPVIKRRIGLELVEMLELTSLFLARGGWGMVNRACYPDQKAYRRAVGRLRGQGLVVQRMDGGKTPRLVLTDAGLEALPDYFDPEKRWNKQWNGIWYMLVYDVPESDRAYRDVLRRFLRKMHLGCLQQSVWITPYDIRPQFDDLAKAAGVDSFAYLFESRTVLGLPHRSVVENAWNLDRLNGIQRHYCDVMERNLSALMETPCEMDELAGLMRLAMQAYHGAFATDPLLPRALWPVAYLGEKVLDLHRHLLREIGKQLPDV